MLLFCLSVQTDHAETSSRPVLSRPLPMGTSLQQSNVRTLHATAISLDKSSPPGNRPSLFFLSLNEVYLALTVVSTGRFLSSWLRLASVCCGDQCSGPSDLCFCFYFFVFVFVCMNGGAAARAGPGRGRGAAAAPSDQFPLQESSVSENSFVFPSQRR